MTIPIHHSPGDLEHTEDHNSIVDVLTDHATELIVLQNQITALPSSFMSKSGNNVVQISNPAGYGTSMVIPPGTRDSGAYVMTVIYAGKQTFGLDSFGQVRAGSAQDALVPMEVFGASSGQSADLLRFRKTGVFGAIVSRVDANGNFYAPNITPGAWTNLPLAGGIVAAHDVGTAPMYRLVGDEVQIRGSCRKSSGNFNGSPTQIGTIPSGYTPVYLTMAVTGAASVGNFYSVRMEMGTNGSLSVHFPHGSYQPNWITLDGMRYSRTPGS
jgi:hypothetical protein